MQQINAVLLSFHKRILEEMHYIFHKKILDWGNGCWKFSFASQE